MEALPREELEAALGLAWLSKWGCSPLQSRLPHNTAGEIWTASRSTLRRWGLAPAAIGRFEERRRVFAPAELVRQLEQSALTFVPYGSALYPTGLTHLKYPPAGLFARGSTEAWDTLLRVPRIGVVGTRRASPYGRRATEALSSAFSQRGVVVVSGMAFGIDACAHEAALDLGALTVAVLGCGADVVYPRRHKALYDKIGAGGVILSELPPGCPPARWTFPHRNRVLAALADAVLVIEGSHTSGALQTASWALELGRSVFAVPGPILVNSYEGCNTLIYDGATPALQPCAAVEDFLRETGMERGARMLPDLVGPVSREDGRAAGAISIDAPVLDALEAGPCSVDELTGRTGLPAREVTACLALAELAGKVRRAGPGLYIRAP